MYSIAQTNSDSDGCENTFACRRSEAGRILSSQLLDEMSVFVLTRKNDQS